MFDVHTHFVPPELLDWLRLNASQVSATWEQRVPGKAAFLTVNNKWSFELKPEFHDASLYLQSQRDAGIQHALVSPIPQLFLYDFPVSMTSEAAEVYNRSLSEWVRMNKDDVSGLATVSLNHPETAANELRTALGLGLKGAIIGPGHSGCLLSDAQFTPFWEEADYQRAIVFIHPLLNEDPRIQRKMMPNLIGVPWETTICGLDLIVSGVLDRYPNVRIILAHGGGFLPYQVGRFNQGYASWPVIQSSLQMSPEEYLKRLWFDNVLWHPEALRFLQTVVGRDRVLPGSDFPFDLKTWPPAEADEAACRRFLSL